MNNNEAKKKKITYHVVDRKKRKVWLHCIQAKFVEPGFLNQSVKMQLKTGIPPS